MATDDKPNRERPRSRLLGRMIDWIRRRSGLTRLLLGSQPRNWLDAEGWDAHWRAMLADAQERSDYAGPFWRDPFIERYLPVARDRAMRRILFAGNGISLEPHAFAHCGFEVTAVDISPSACDFVRDYRLTPEQMGHFLPAYRETTHPDYGQVRERDPAASLDRVAEEHRPGGRLEVVCADLLRWSSAAPFDLLYAERAIQGFPEEVQRELAARFFAWLNPGGIAVVSMVHATDQLERLLEGAFEAAGFFVHLKETHAWHAPQLRALPEEGLAAFEREYTARTAAEEALERERMAAGEKQVVFWNSLS